MTHTVPPRTRRVAAMVTVAAVLVSTLAALATPATAVAEEPAVTTTTIAPARDLFVQDYAANANTTFLTDRLIIGASRKALLAFPVAELPEGSAVTAARLELYKVHGTDGEIAGRAILGPWGSDVTFNTLPPLGEQVAVTTVPYVQNQWFSWELRAAVAASVNAGETEFDLYMDRTSGTGGTEYASSRHANAGLRPRLVVETMQIDELLAADAADLSSVISSPVYENITLPAEGSRGSTITWASSDPSRITADGTVTRPASSNDDEVILTATLTYGDQTTTQEVPVTVRGTYDVEISHPQVHVNADTHTTLDSLLANEDWAGQSLENLTANLEPYVERHQADPEWILSRMSMFWEEGKRYTQTYVASGQVFDRGEGNAPVPTVRMAAMRIWNSNSNAPLEDRLPYSDGSMRNQNGDIVPYMETGHMVRGNNVDILKMAETAGFIYYATGDERYAKFGSDILNQWLAGTYYMEPPLDPTRALFGAGGYEPGGISGYYDYEVIHDETGGIAAPAYDFLYDYMVEHPAPAIEGTGKSLTDVAGTVFKRFIDIAMVRGNKTGNWNVFTWLNTVPIILALETNDYYPDGEGREHYLQTYTTTSTEYREALPGILTQYDPVTGMWPESTGYAFGTIENLLELAGPIYNNGIDTIASNDVMKKSALATLQWLDARGNVVIVGDGRGGPPSYTPLERMNWYFQSVGDTANAAAVSAAIQKAVDAGYYDRSKMGYRGLLYSAALVPADGTQTNDARTLYSPFHRFLLQRNGSDPANALMATVNGGYPQQFHLNERGLAAQIWGKGWAVGPTNSVYESYWTDDYLYSRNPAGSNTVVPGYAHGEITVNGLDPAVPSDRLTNATETSSSYSFSDVTGQGHRRQLAIVRTSPESGYYVDVFRADQATADYLWHNLGTQVSLTGADGGALATTASDALGRPIDSYRFFQNTEAVTYSDDFKATWTVPDGVAAGQDLKTDMWQVGQSGRTIFTTDGLPTTRNGNVTPNAVNSLIDGEPTPTVIVRQTDNNAAQSPFISVFESYGEGEQTVSSVEDYASAGAFVGIKVTSASIDGRVDRVLSSADDEEHTPADGVSFRGLYGVASADDDGFAGLYLGNGTAITADGYGIRATEPLAAALERDGDALIYTAPSAVSLTLPVDAPEGAGVWVEVRAAEGWVRVPTARDGDAVVAEVPAGQGVPVRSVVDVEGPDVEVSIARGTAEVTATDAGGLTSLSAVLVDLAIGTVVNDLGTVTVEGTSGSHSFALPADLGYGSYEVRATATDVFGNTSTGTARHDIELVDAATAKPAKGRLTHDNGWDTGLLDGSYNITMDMWWGENGSLYRLYENGALVATIPLTYNGVAEQHAVVPITGKPNGSYLYTGEIINSKGSTPVAPVTVQVTDANPGKPILSHDNGDGDGNFTVTANMWWGTNATSFAFYENGVLVAEGSLAERTPAAQVATMPVTGKAKGNYTYRVEFRNAAGSTSSADLKVTVKR